MKFFGQSHSFAFRAVTFALAMFAVFHAFFPGATPSAQVATQKNKTNQLEIELDAVSSGYVISERNGQRICREATPTQAQRWRQTDRQPELRTIYPAHTSIKAEGEQAQTGLRITLRATSQLDSFPDAKAAFIRAAQNWEALILTPITIIVDVDFGTTFFGETYTNANIIGQTASQSLVSRTGYPTFKAALLDGASSSGETNLYNALPASQLPTDVGDVAAVSTSSSVFRALGLISATANPDAEPNFGPPPRIGFNSAFTFDFNPNDGISPGLIDFDAVATHEIGHLLGFSSNVGAKELNSTITTSVSVLDMFRFRPGITLNTFGTAQRILSSGGTHSFFGGNAELGLSTGRPDGTGGDDEQASHWKADEQSGVYLGIMDPTASRGRREQITQNDLHAFDTIGYRVRSQQQQLNVAPRSLDFGDAALNTNVDRTLTISNTGGQSLQISNITSNNAQFRVVSPTGAFSVPSNGSQTVTVRFTPTANGTQSATLTIASNDPNSASVAVALTGFGGTQPTVVLSSGAAQNGTIQPPLSATTCRMDPTQYTIQVPSGATQLRVTLSGNQDVDLYARFGQRITGSTPDWLADHVSDSPNSTESFTIASSSSPTLRAGTYFIGVTNCDPAVATYTVTATVTGGSTSTVAAVSAASFRGTELTGESIASVFGQNLASGTVVANTATLPTALSGSSVRVRDSAGNERLAPLFFVSALQVNFLVPVGTSVGPATITATNGSGATATGTINIVTVAPGLFAANGNGQGAAAAVVLRVAANNSQTFESVARFDTATSRFVTVPINLGVATDQVYLVLYGTGLRNRSALSAVSASVGGVASQVTYAGPQNTLFGLDQINVLLPRTLAGRGEVDAVLTVDGKTTNTVRVSIQ